MLTILATYQIWWLLRIGGIDLLIENDAEGVELVAMGDLFPDRLEQSSRRLAEALGDAFKVTPESSFSGFDAYQKVIDSDVDLVILASPPGFRPQHLRAAIDAGKHVFTEKPVAVDPVGIRSVIETADLAKSKNLAIVAGTQRRHDPKYVETIRRIHDGAIGEVLSGQVYWNQGGLWTAERKPEMSDSEWQIRNWLYFAWLSGDHVVEQHVHNIDVANWVLGGHPVRVNGVGGRQVRTGPEYGHIYDHFCVEMEYENGARVTSMCRQQDGTEPYVGEFFLGTAGTSNSTAGGQWGNWQMPSSCCCRPALPAGSRGRVGDGPSASIDAFSPEAPGPP